jgi:uncharacterized membrane protein
MRRWRSSRWREWLHLVTKDTVVIIDAMALIIVTIGTAEAFFTGLWAAFPAPAHLRFPEILVRYGRRLVAGLTFPLAADIIETSVTPTWQEVGQRGDCCDTNLSELFPRAGLGRAWEGS